MEEKKIIVYVKEIVVSVASKINDFLKTKGMLFNVEEFYAYLGIETAIRSDAQPKPIIGSLIENPVIPKTSKSKSTGPKTSNQGTHSCIYVTHKKTGTSDPCKYNTMTDLHGFPYCKTHATRVAVKNNVEKGAVMKLDRDGKTSTEVLTMAQFIEVINSSPDQDFKDKAIGKKPEKSSSAAGAASTSKIIQGMVPPGYVLQTEDDDSTKKKSDAVKTSDGKLIMDEKYVIEKTNPDGEDSDPRNFKVIGIQTNVNDNSSRILEDKFTKEMIEEVKILRQTFQFN